MGFYINFIHTLCSAGARLPRVSVSPGGVRFARLRWESSQQPSSRRCGWWCARRPCRGAGAGGVFALGRPVRFRAGKRPSVSRLPASLRQSAAELRPLCGFGGRVPAGASERWAANKAGSRLLPTARPRAGTPVPLVGLRQSCALWRPTDRPRGALAWERPPGLDWDAHGGCPHSALLLFPHGGASPYTPLGGWPRRPWGEARGDHREELLQWGAGLPFPPLCLPRQPKFGPGVQRVAARRRQGCRGLSWQESGNQNICAQAWAPQPLMVLTELLWSVVWKICILRRARGGPRHRRPWRYLNITASRRGVR